MERGRESDQPIALRLDRGTALTGMAVPDVVIDNSGELGSAVDAFVKALHVGRPLTA